MIIITKGTQDIVRRAINRAVDVIAPTYGIAGNKVIIKNQLHSTIVDDGVQIARDLVLPDAVENAVWERAKEVAIRTNDRVGDGTTSSLIMLRALINGASSSKKSAREIELELKAGVLDVQTSLRGQAVPIKTKQELRKVARVSFDNEPVANLIADTWFSLGADGVITLDKSQTMETYVEVTDGITLDQGFVSPYMVTNPERMESIVEKPYILLTNYKLSNAEDIIGIMNKLVGVNVRSLVIIADGTDTGALATLIVNRMQQDPSKIFLSVAVNIPSGDKEQVLEDLAILTGARVISESKGDKLEDVEVKDLGRADRFIAKRDSSVILKPKGPRSSILSATAALRVMAAKENDEKLKKKIQERLARMTGKVAVMKVGGMTEAEHRALRFKVEDAVNAVQVAYKSGVVRGAGLALASCKTSSRILNAALQAPHETLMSNCGIDPVELGKNEAVNLSTGQEGNFIDVGVVDPVDVLIAGVDSAVSIACILLTSTAIMVEKPKTN